MRGSGYMTSKPRINSPTLNMFESLTVSDYLHVIVVQQSVKYSRTKISSIRGTLNLSMFADSSTNTKTQKMFSQNMKEKREKKDMCIVSQFACHLSPGIHLSVKKIILGSFDPESQLRLQSVFIGSTG